MVDGALTTFFRGRWAILHMTVGEKMQLGSNRRRGASATAERRGQGADATAKKRRAVRVRGGRALRQVAEEARLRNEQEALPGKRAPYREINVCQATSMGPKRKLIIPVG